MGQIDGVIYYNHLNIKKKTHECFKANKHRFNYLDFLIIADDVTCVTTVAWESTAQNYIKHYTSVFR